MKKPDHKTASVLQAILDAIAEHNADAERRDAVQDAQIEWARANMVARLNGLPPPMRH